MLQITLKNKRDAFVDVGKYSVTTVSSHGKVDIVGVGIPFNEQVALFHDSESCCLGAPRPFQLVFHIGSTCYQSGRTISWCIPRSFAFCFFQSPPDSVNKVPFSEF